MLVACLGLRSAEVARLELGDIDWRAGQITLRGKACRQDGMPPPCDVGEALAAYLSQTRPATALRQVFLAAKAPVRAIPPGLVSDPAPRKSAVSRGSSMACSVGARRLLAGESRQGCFSAGR
jgi:integrase